MANYTIDMLMTEEPTVDIEVNQETINTPLSESLKQIELQEEDSHDNGRGKNVKLITQKNEGKVQSRYLRASTGSCHDSCKYGHKHSFNEESKIPLSTVIKKRMAEMREEKKKAAMDLEQKRMSLPNLTHNKGITQSSNELSGNRRFSEIVPPMKTGIPLASSTISRPPTVRRRSDINLQKEKVAPPPSVDRNSSNQKKQHDPVQVDSFPEMKSTPKEITQVDSFPEMKSAPKEITDEEVPEKTLYIIETNPNDNDQNNISIESTPPPNEMKIGECGVDTRLIHHQSSSPSSKSKVLKSNRNGKKPAPSLPPPPQPSTVSASTKSIKSDIPKASILSTRRQKNGGVKSEPPSKLKFRREKAVDLPSEATSALRTRKLKEGGVTSGSKSDSSKKFNSRRGIDLPSENTIPSRARKLKEGVTSVKRSDSPWKLSSRKGKTVDLQPETTTSPFRIRKAKEGGVSLIKRSDSARKLNFRRGRTVDPPPSENNNILRRLKFKLTRVPSSESRLGKNDEKKPISKKTMKSAESSRQNIIAGVKMRARNFINSGAAAAVKGDELSKKVSFRRGKVIDIKPINTTPRRLNFRVARIVMESSNGIKRSGSRREGVEKSNNNGSNNPGKVILRHREVEEGSKRRESQSSVNNVIEETANKLVQTRKSKVKALVGAFETIISLHDK